MRHLLSDVSGKEFSKGFKKLKVCRNVDLRKVTIKGSKGLRESPLALDGLTKGQPLRLARNTHQSMRVCKCRHSY